MDTAQAWPWPWPRDLKSIPLPLELVLNIITCSLPRDPNVLLAPSHPVTQLLLTFTLVCRETRRVANRYLLQHCVYLSTEARLRCLLLQLPKRKDLREVPSMLLAPFETTLDNQPTAMFVRELFNYTCGSLRRLIIDMPLRSLRPENDHLDVQRILREGFIALENLEEFVSVRDELYLGNKLEPWRRWPNLKRLALYNQDANNNFWYGVAVMQNLETLVLTRSDGLRYSNIKKIYCQFQKQDPVRPLKVLLIDVEDEQIRYGNLQREGWDRVDPQKNMTIMTYNVPSLYADEDPIEVCQEYVKTGAENGTLWTWEGEVMPHMPVIAPETASREPLEQWGYQ